MNIFQLLVGLGLSLIGAATIATSFGQDEKKEARPAEGKAEEKPAAAAEPKS